MKNNVVIGKYTLESLTNGMYSSALDLYREYIQNAVDSIDEAVSAAFVDNSIKTKNNEVIRNANKISKAISEEVQVTFKYFDYDVDGKIIYKKCNCYV